MGVTFDLTDNSAAILSELQIKLDTALEAVGLQAEAHAKNIIKTENRVDTGYMRNNITHMVKDDYDEHYKPIKVAIIGTNVHYAVFNEIGTGKWNSEGNGRQGWWVYVEDDGSGSRFSPSRNVGKTYTEEEARRIVAILRAKGLKAHMTEGMKPIHFLKRAIEEHKDEYKAMIQHFMKT